MSKDPSSVFAGISQSCIRDEYVEDEKVIREGVLMLILGIGSSVMTVYVLSLLGLFV
ncbi:MAG TPA: hypothetical protein VEC08_04420 [Nitrososphaerales archaeon]|nr:hypothetical protein [Nitrososphaerales archaeon]